MMENATCKHEKPKNKGKMQHETNDNCIQMPYEPWKTYYPTEISPLALWSHHTYMIRDTVCVCVCVCMGTLANHASHLNLHPAQTLHTTVLLCSSALPAHK